MNSSSRRPRDFRPAAPAPQKAPKPAPTSVTPASRAEVAALREQLLALIRKSPDKAAILLTAWIHSTPEKQKKTG